MAREAGADPVADRPREVDVAIVRALRASILRPGQPPERLHYPGDEEPDTLHAAVLDASGAALGVASVMLDPFPPRPSPTDWRIRGTAVQIDARRRGIGASLLERCERHARDRGGQLLWCNARVPARTLYERGGLHVVGDVFEIPDIGPHYLMCKRL